MPRAIMRVDLTPKSKELFTEIADRQGMTQLAVTSRLVEWFTKLPPELQHRIMVDWEKGTDANLARKLLEPPESKSA